MALFGIGGSSSSSKSKQEAQSTDIGASRTRQNLAFADLFGNMYGNAATKAAGISGEGIGTAAQQLFSGGNKFLDMLQQSNASDYMNARLSGVDSVLPQQISTLREEMGRLFSEELNPAITSAAVGSRGLGGGRQGVAQGVAASGIGREFSRGVVDLLSASQGQKDTLAGTLLGGQNQAAGIGLGGLSGLLGLAEAQDLAPMLGSSALSKILGSPVALTESDSFNYGQSTSKGTSKGKSAGFNLGFG